MNTGMENSNQWVLVDYLNDDQAGLLSIGAREFHGSSVRKNLDLMGRELLTDHLRTVAETLVPVDETVEKRGRAYRVVVEPVTSPESNALVAVRAIYAPAEVPLTPPPVVGALEWLIWNDGRIEATWNRDMFRLYEIEHIAPAEGGGAASPTGDMNEWVSQLIAPEDRARMKLTIDSGIKDSNGRRYFVHYRIITRRGSENPGIKNLEVSSSCNTDPVLPMRRLRAITREVAELKPAMNPEFGDTGDLMSAVFALSTESVLAAVDLSRWQMFMSSPSWTDFGIQQPKFGYLPHIIHPDDFTTFRDSVTEGPSATARVRLLHLDGEFRPYEVTSSSGRDKASDAEYIICKMKALESV